MSAFAIQRPLAGRWFSSLRSSNAVAARTQTLNNQRLFSKAAVGGTRKSFTRKRDKLKQVARDLKHDDPDLELGKLVKLHHKAPKSAKVFKPKHEKRKARTAEQLERRRLDFEVEEDLSIKDHLREQIAEDKKMQVDSPPPAVRLTLEEVLQILEEEKAEKIFVIDMRRKCDFTDYFIICEGFSVRHRRAIADTVVRKMKERRVYTGANVEGREEAKDWFLVDMGDLVVHVFSAKGRAYYDVEELWCVRRDYVSLIHEEGVSDPKVQNYEEDYTKLPEDYFEEIRMVADVQIDN